MALKDISWGAVLVGAAFATAFVAVSPEIFSAVAISSVAKLGIAAVVGGITGEFVSDLLHRCGTAVSAVTSR